MCRLFMRWVTWYLELCQVRSQCFSWFYSFVADRDITWRIYASLAIKTLLLLETRIQRDAMINILQLPTILGVTCRFHLDD